VSDPAKSKTVFYASLGPALTLYDLDIAGAALVKRSTVTLPANIQYAWPHPSRRCLYVVSSNGGPGITGDKHFASALLIDPATGGLRPHGEPAALPSRPIHVSVDAAGGYLLTAYNNPSNVTVHRLNTDRTVGAPVTQSAGLDTGIYAHQVLAAPGNRRVVLVTRGNNAGDGKPEDPGAIKTFGFANGLLSNLASIAPGNGLGFGPRHLDFHPTKPWAFVSIERQNKLYVCKLDDATGLARDPMFIERYALRSRVCGTARRRPDSRSSQWQIRLCDQSDFSGVRSGRESDCQRRRKQRRGVCHRPDHRRTAAHSEHRRPRHPVAHLRHRSKWPPLGCCQCHVAARRHIARRHNDHAHRQRRQAGVCAQIRRR